MDVLQHAMLQFRAMRMSATHDHIQNESRQEQHEQSLIPYSRLDAEGELSTGITGTQSGSKMIALFAEAAATQLSTVELQSMVHFFNSPILRNNSPPIESKLTMELELFYRKETQITGEGRDRLTRPSGSELADLCVILHCQSKEGAVGEFWDEGNQTIQTLAGKGLAPDNCFGFDWHWRAEGIARHRSANCPATSWNESTRALHNEMSHRVLDILPLPFVIVAGACPRKNYQTREQTTTRRITVTISGGVKIAYDLDFGQGVLKRIAVFVAHPSVGFFRRNTSVDEMARLDAALNLFLYVLAVDHNEAYYVTKLSSTSKGIPGCAPLAEMHEYRRLEEQLGRPLRIEEYDAGFLSWAQRYLGRSTQGSIDTVGSMSQDLYKAWKASLSKSFQDPKRQQEHSRHNRLNNARRYGWVFIEYWHGQQVVVHKNGLVRLHTSLDKKALKFQVSKQARELCTKSQKSPTILFDEDGLCLKLGSDIIFRKTRSQLSKLTCFGAEGLKHLDKELMRLSVTCNGAAK